MREHKFTRLWSVTLLTALLLALSGNYKSEAQAVQDGNELSNSIGMKFTLIRNGEFKTSSSNLEPGLSCVTISKDYYLGVHEVTVAQYRQVMGASPGGFQRIAFDAQPPETGLDHPVEHVSWEQAVEFCKRLSKLPEERAAGRTYRLPTGAEWEYACRAGNGTDYGVDDAPNLLLGHSWFAENSDRQTHPVGQKLANQWGVHDMHGNVSEWCSDWFDPEVSTKENTTDPTGPDTGFYKMIRGGSWLIDMELCRCDVVGHDFPESVRAGTGFRLVMDLKPTKINVEALVPLTPPVSQLEPPKEVINSIGLKLVLIPRGSFTMGSPKSEENRNDDEVEHQVTISHDFYLGVFEVTQSQYEQVMDVNPSTFQGNRAVDRHPPSGRVIRYLDSSDHPVEKVAWKDAVTFCERLSTLPEEKAAGRVYRLPTEAEWEYACRANSKSTYGFDGTAESLEDYGWFIRNSGNQALDTDELLKQLQNDRKKLAEAVLSEGCRTHKVGEKRPNAWGLYDMHGNVWEWCSDWYGDYPKDAVIDPTGPGIDTDRVKRGGSWFNKPQYCRSAQRNYAPPDDKSPESGFRVLLIVSSQEHTTQPKGRPMSIPDLGD